MPTSPPHVFLPTSGPICALRKYHGKASPPEPDISLMSITFGPKIASDGLDQSWPSRVTTLLINGLRRYSTM